MTIILGVNINFMKGFHDLAEYEYFDKYTHETKTDNLDGYHQINHHWTKDFYGEENAKILDKVSEITCNWPGLAGGKEILQQQ